MWYSFKGQLSVANIIAVWTLTTSKDAILSKLIKTRIVRFISSVIGNRMCVQTPKHQNMFCLELTNIIRPLEVVGHGNERQLQVDPVKK